MSELSELYQDLILDHGKSPRNLREIDNPTHSAEGFNPLCGDRVQVFLRIDDDGNIVDASFDGSGCAICTASSSLMTLEIVHHSTKDAREKFHAMQDLLAGDSQAGIEEIGRLAALSGVRRFPMRVKCATLPWHTLISALDEKKPDEPVTTE